MSSETIRIFIVQGDGEPRTLLFDPNATVEKLLENFRKEDVIDEELFLFKEDGDDVIEAHLSLMKAEIGRGTKLHVHRHRRILVTVNYSDKSPSKEFTPGTTVRRVKEWAEKEFGIKDDDTIEYALQLCGSQVKPPESTHVGTLVKGECRDLCFDLKPHPKVNG